VPDGVRLARELGMESELVAPAAGKALLWTGGQLKNLPAGLVLGAPGRLFPLVASGILSPAGILRAGLDLVLPASDWSKDLPVATVIARRFGRQVAERLVDPLVGGIHAGRTEELSVESTAPQLLQAARARRSLLLGLRQMPTPPTGPTFLAPRAGMGRLVERLVEALDEKGVRFEAVPVTAVRVGKGAGVVIEPAGVFDAAVVATPGRVAAQLLHQASPEAAEGLAGIRTASVALVTMAYPRRDLDLPLETSGILVPRFEGHLMTACSFGSVKWPHWSDPTTTVLRVSAGRAGDERALQLPDDELVDRLQGEIGQALGTRSSPTAWRVSRWPDAFPQYEVGHLGRVARIESLLRRSLPAVALAGASFRGSGIPACVASGRRAASMLIGAVDGET
jgi:oxygen-dependent protoporphyrinogen oxidase